MLESNWYFRLSLFICCAKKKKTIKTKKSALHVIYWLRLPWCWKTRESTVLQWYLLFSGNSCSFCHGYDFSHLLKLSLVDSLKISGTSWDYVTTHRNAPPPLWHRLGYNMGTKKKLFQRATPWMCPRLSKLLQTLSSDTGSLTAAAHGWLALIPAGCFSSSESAGQSVTLSKCHVSLHPTAHSTNDGRLSLCPSLAGKTLHNIV